MSSINIPLGASSKPYTLPGGGSSTAVSLEVKKGSAGLEVTAHDADSQVATSLNVTEELAAYLEAVGISESTFNAEAFNAETVNASVLAAVATAGSVPDLQA